MRILDRISTQLTTLHKVLLDDLFKLATTVYTEVSLVYFSMLFVTLFIYWFMTKRGQDSWILAKFSFWRRCDGPQRPHAKKERGQYLAILTEQTWSRMYYVEKEHYFITGHGG